MQFAVFLALILACIGGWIWLFQERMVFFPSRESVVTPAAAGMRYEDVFLETPDFGSLHGWYLPADEPRGTVLFCHGNAGNISHRLETLTLLHGLRFNVLIFDYRGYGRSTGKPTEDNTYEDASLALAYLLSEKGESPSRIVLMGRSLGAAVAVHLAAKFSPAALIIESGFTSVPDLGKRIYPFLPRFLARIRYDSMSRIAAIKCPILVAHSPDDEIIPYAMGRKLYEAAVGPKRFLEMRGDHNAGFLVSGCAYIEGLELFFKGQAGL